MQPTFFSNKFLNTILPATLILLFVLGLLFMSNPIIMTIVLSANAGILFLYLISIISIKNRISQINQELQNFASRPQQKKLTTPSEPNLAKLTDSINQVLDENWHQITVLEHQKNELEFMVSSLDEAVLVIDAEEHILRINQAGCELFNTADDHCIGKTIQEIIRQPELHQFIRKTLAFGIPAEEEIVLNGPETRYLQTQGKSLISENKTIIGALIVFNDITKIKKLENLRRDFVANVSHELKTPITTIKGYVETLIDDNFQDREQSVKFLDIILRNSDRLNAIIEDLLNLSRIEQEYETRQITQEKSSLNNVIQNALTACTVQAKNKQVSLTFSPKTEIFCQMNAPLIENALINLIDNAIKYSDPGKSVTIESEIKNNHIAIRVSDNGCGIAQEYLQRIFERFYRVDKARSRKLGGTGLGLAIVKHIVQAHRGQITVESQPGRGSTFTILLKNN